MVCVLIVLDYLSDDRLGMGFLGVYTRMVSFNYRYLIMSQLIMISIPINVLGSSIQCSLPTSK